MNAIGFIINIIRQIMSKINGRVHGHQARTKSTFESRITQSSTCKSFTKSSFNNSLAQSSSSSLSNISASFFKEANFPRLFSDSSMLFSFNPQSVKSSSCSNKLSSVSAGRTFNLAPNSHFFKKKTARKDNNPKQAKKKDLLEFGRESKLFRDNQAGHSLKLSSSTTKHSEVHLRNYDSSSFHSVPKEQNIKVYIRMKPSQQQLGYLQKNYIHRLDENHLEMNGKVMAYDHVFSISSNQEDIFNKIAKPVVDNVLEGYNGTIFSYGQTGSGKTYTIFGKPESSTQGLIFRTISYLFENKQSSAQLQFSLLEIYKQELADLLTQQKGLKIKQLAGGIGIEGLTKCKIQHPLQAVKFIDEASKQRRVACTKLNQQSSRSHTILTLYLKSSKFETKMCLIDLAGSEKVNKSGVSGEALEEAKKINYSLSCLGNVINALVTRKKTDHIPFRDSKLTRILKDSLTGKFKTSVIVNCSCDPGTEEETLSSLKFADRAKKIKVTLSKNICKEKQNIEYLQKVIHKLTSDLESTKSQLTKYKQICKNNQSGAEQNAQVTARLTIPSERLHVDKKMELYGKENQHIANLRRNAEKSSFDLNQLSSLNVSKSIVNFFGEISPSLSSLSYRRDENVDDLSLNFSLQREESNCSRKAE